MVWISKPLQSGQMMNCHGKRLHSNGVRPIASSQSGGFAPSSVQNGTKTRNYKCVLMHRHRHNLAQSTRLATSDLCVMGSICVNSPNKYLSPSVEMYRLPIVQWTFVSKALQSDHPRQELRTPRSGSMQNYRCLFGQIQALWLSSRGLASQVPFQNTP